MVRTTLSGGLHFIGSLLPTGHLTLHRLARPNRGSHFSKARAVQLGVSILTGSLRFDGQLVSYGSMQLGFVDGLCCFGGLSLVGINLLHLDVLAIDAQRYPAGCA